VIMAFTVRSRGRSSFDCAAMVEGWAWCRAAEAALAENAVGC
jgi:hypothetical protein